MKSLAFAAALALACAACTTTANPPPRRDLGRSRRRRLERGRARRCRQPTSHRRNRPASSSSRTTASSPSRYWPLPRGRRDLPRQLRPRNGGRRRPSRRRRLAAEELHRHPRRRRRRQGPARHLEAGLRLRRRRLVEGYARTGSEDHRPQPDGDELGPEGEPHLRGRAGHEILLQHAGLRDHEAGARRRLEAIARRRHQRVAHRARPA